MVQPSQSLRFGPISPAAPGPLYEQVIAAVKREVAAGRLVEGDALPSLRALAADLLVSLITIKRAYDELEREGIIYSRQGLGAFVARAGAEQLRLQRAEAARRGLGDAVRAARQAGMSRDELSELLTLEWEKSHDHDPGH
jgi:GntR family transcriptional regulator